MSTFIQNLPIIERLGWALIHSLWQWTIIGLLAWLTLRALHRRSPQARYLATVSLLAAGTMASAVTFALVTPTSHSEQLQNNATPTTVIEDQETNPSHEVAADANESELTLWPSEAGSNAAAVGAIM